MYMMKIKINIKYLYNLKCINKYIHFFQTTTHVITYLIVKTYDSWYKCDK